MTSAELEVERDEGEGGEFAHVLVPSPSASETSGGEDGGSEEKASWSSRRDANEGGRSDRTEPAREHGTPKTRHPVDDAPAENLGADGSLTGTSTTTTTHRGFLLARAVRVARVRRRFLSSRSVSGSASSRAASGRARFGARVVGGMYGRSPVRDPGVPSPRSRRENARRMREARARYSDMTRRGGALNAELRPRRTPRGDHRDDAPDAATATPVRASSSSHPADSSSSRARSIQPRPTRSATSTPSRDASAFPARTTPRADPREPSPPRRRRAPRPTARSRRNASTPRDTERRASEGASEPPETIETTRRVRRCRDISPTSRVRRCRDISPTTSRAAASRPTRTRTRLTSRTRTRPSIRRRRRRHRLLPRRRRRSSRGERRTRRSRTHARRSARAADADARLMRAAAAPTPAPPSLARASGRRATTDGGSRRVEPRRRRVRIRG